MIIKSYLLERNISEIEECFATLIYGENIGFKDDIKYQIKEKYKKVDKIYLNQDDILKNSKVLTEQIENTSLFSKNKIIFINQVSEKIRKILMDVLETPRNDLKIFIFADTLEKKSILRSFFEKSRVLKIVPCYQDNERTLAEYLRKKFVGYTGLTQEIINLLIKNSGLDRKTLSNEIEKIKSLFLDKKIKSEKIISLINNPYNLDFDNLRDACFSAEKDKLNDNLGNVALQNEDAYFYLNSLNYRVEKLIALSEQCNEYKSVDMAIEKIRPPIFWKDKPTFSKQLKKWNISKLNQAKKHINTTEILIKTKLHGCGDVLIKNLLVKLCCIANATS